MDKNRIKQYVDEIFAHVVITETVIEQKEELTVNLTERVKDYMDEGLSFDMAFEAAKTAIGDINELTAQFAKQRVPETAVPAAPSESKSGTSVSERLQNWQIAALSPFVYLFLGAFFGWWAWAWLIIPVAGILSTPMRTWAKLVALSPFIYVAFGFFFGWWAWGWVIIPVMGILSQHESIRTH